MPFSVHTVTPVTGFEAQEFTAPGVGIRVGMMLAPSIFTTDTPVAADNQLPLGMYEVTSVPMTCADSELDGWQDPCGTSPARIL